MVWTLGRHSEGEKNLNIGQEIHFPVLFVSHGSLLSIKVETCPYMVRDSWEMERINSLIIIKWFSETP